MFRNTECRLYRKWKREHSKKPKKEVKKDRLKKNSVTDCIDEYQAENVATVSSERCKKEKKIRKPKTRETHVYKIVSLSELLLNRIKPSLEVRERFLNPRHFVCLQTDSSTIGAAPDVTEITSKIWKNSFRWLFLVQFNVDRSINVLTITKVWLDRNAIRNVNNCIYSVELFCNIVEKNEDRVKYVKLLFFWKELSFLWYIYSRNTLR